MAEIISCSAVLRLNLHADVLEEVRRHDTAGGDDDDFVGYSHEFAALFDDHRVLRYLPYLRSHHDVQSPRFPSGFDALAVARFCPGEGLTAV